MNYKKALSPNLSKYAPPEDGGSGLICLESIIQASNIKMLTLIVTSNYLSLPKLVLSRMKITPPDIFKMSHRELKVLSFVFKKLQMDYYASTIETYVNKISQLQQIQQWT